MAGWGVEVREGDASHGRFDLEAAGDRVVGGDGREDGDGDALVPAEGGREGVHPGSVGAGEDDGEDGAADAPGEGEGAGLEGELDAEDGALGEEEEAVAGGSSTLLDASRLFQGVSR